MTADIITTDGRSIVLDLSNGATLCGEAIAGCSVDQLTELINRTMSDAGTGYAFGRYAEPRDLYSNDNFAIAGSSEKRTVHMGIDLFCAAATPIYAPHDATVEIVANNAADLDYGPLVILAHDDAAESRYSLYGHLGSDILSSLREGQKIAKGEPFATVGAPPDNGNWPPHLHFQLIRDLNGLGADFPGVARKSQQDRWLKLSPSPAAYFPEIDASRLEYA